jgi:DNA (cytosine-5)-methyltransferase 1
MSLKIISLFSGAGGFDLGFELEGIETIMATDIHPRMVETLRYNKGKDFRPIKFLRRAEIHQGDLAKSINFISSFNADIVLGGPPCQSFSAIGSQVGYDDQRGSLIYSFAQVINNVNPRYFLFENVPNMKSKKWVDLFDKFLNFLRFNGRYKVNNFLLNCADYGCATIRERIFIFGCRSDTGVTPSAPAPTHSGAGDLFSSKLHVTVRDALVGLPLPKTKFDFPFLHFSPAHKPEIISRFIELRPGERDHIRRRNRLDLDKPALTIFAGGEMGGTRAHIHPTEPRELTPRELARLHGFPDEFTFCGNKSQIAIQIVNSVPVPMASAWARHISRLDSQCL